MTAQLQFTGGGVTALGNSMTQFTPTPGAIRTRAERWASGSGTTLTSLALPLQQGQLMPANIAQVSVWRLNTEIAAYVEPLGTWPDGSARTLFIQTSQTLTNGVPVVGEVRLTGGFTVARRTRVDDSATWVNNNTTTWRSGGLPEGAIVATSAAHLCAASSFGLLVPQATQPVFSGSANVDVAFDAAYEVVIVGDPDGSSRFPAYYDRVVAINHKYCRTANTKYLKDAIAHAARMRTVHWAPNSFNANEQYSAPKSYTWLYLMRRDTPALDAIKLLAAFIGIDPADSYHNYGGRFIGKILGFVAGAVKCGFTTQLDPYGTKTYQDLINICITQGLTKGSNKLTQTNDAISFRKSAEDGVTDRWAHVGFMVGLYADAMIDLINCAPTSTQNLAAMRAQLVASLGRLNTELATTSDGGSRTYNYANVIYYYGAAAGTVASTYVSGTTININVPSLAGSAGANGFLIIGGVSRAHLGTTFDGSGNGTLTLTEGFPTGHAAATVVSFVRADGGPDINSVDLNGFFPSVFAWRATQTNNVADANEARAVYAPIGFTPRNGSNGPDIQSAFIKKFEESFYISPLALAYLQQSGL